MPSSNDPKWGTTSVEDVLAQVRKLMLRICREDQGFGSVTLTLTPGKLDIAQGSNLRYGANQAAVYRE